MSCEASRATYHARRAADPAVAATFGGSAQAARALDEIFAIARAQAERRLGARGDEQSRIATLRAQAEDQQAEDATLALFADMHDRYSLRPPVHSRSGLPRKDAQYGYAAVYRTLQAIAGRLALPELARQVRDALVRRRAHGPSAPTRAAEPNVAAPQATRAVKEDVPTAVVQLSTAAARREYEHLVSVRGAKQRRLQHLQIKQAQLGISCDPSIVMEAEDLASEIAELSAQVAARAPVQTVDSPLLSHEQQREALLALAAIAGVPPERIALVDIVIGSIVLVVELPLDAAAHLLALQRLAPHTVISAGFTSVTTEGDRSQPDLEQLVEGATTLLIDPQPDTTPRQPQGDGAPRARLRVVLAAGGVPPT